GTRWARASSVRRLKRRLGRGLSFIGRKETWRRQGTSHSDALARGQVGNPFASPSAACTMTAQEGQREPGELLVSSFDQIEQASLTDVGVRRSHNQDNLAVYLATDVEQWHKSGHLFLVADGMGGHAVGEKASEL